MAHDQESNSSETTLDEPDQASEDDGRKRIQAGVTDAFAPMHEICEGEGRFACYSPKERLGQLVIASHLTQGALLEKLFSEIKE